MIKEIFSEIKSIRPNKKELRQFAFLFTFIFILAGYFVLGTNDNYSYVFLAIALFFLLTGIFAPKTLIPLHKVWMSLATILGFFTTRIILALLFYFIITPLKLFVKKDLLDEKIERSRQSYWQNRTVKKYEKIETERQF